MEKKLKCLTTKQAGDIGDLLSAEGIFNLVDVETNVVSVSMKNRNQEEFVSYIVETCPIKIEYV